MWGGDVGEVVAVGLLVVCEVDVGLLVGFGLGFVVAVAVAVDPALVLPEDDVVLITTRIGETVVSDAVRVPVPDPLDAVNRYPQRPPGSFRVNVNVTPLAYALPPARIRKRPRPAMKSSTLDGLQPNWSAYRTENVIEVVGRPEGGDAFPFDSWGVGCEAPLQLAADTSAAPGTRTAGTASASVSAADLARTSGTCCFRKMTCALVSNGPRPSETRT